MRITTPASARATGKLVITGAKREEQAREAAERMRDILIEKEVLYKK